MMKSDENLKSAIEVWEKAEIQRSANEASNIDMASLWIGDKERYFNPPQNTAFPLEYCYYLLGDIQGKVALDLGCGCCENTLLLAMHGAQVYGLDISPELIEIGRKRFEVNQVSTEKVEFIVGSAYEAGFPDESIDVVFGIGILHHLDLKLIQKEVYRILRKGGFAIFQEPVRDSKFIHFVRGLIPYKAPNVSPFERPLTSEEMQFFSTPFSDVQKRPFILPFTSLIYSLFPRFGRAAFRLDAKILSAMPFLTKYASIRVYKFTK